MKKVLSAVLLSILALSACSMPDSKLDAGGSELRSQAAEQPLAGPNNVQPETPEERALSLGVVHSFDGQPLGFIRTIIWHPGQDNGMGYWQGEWEKRGYHGLAAWDAGGFPYERGGELGREQATLEFSKNTGPFIVKYMCQGTGEVKLTIKDRERNLLASTMQCHQRARATELKLPDKNVEEMTIEQQPLKGTQATYETQVISKQPQTE